MPRRTGSDHHHWNGGRMMMKGYVMVKQEGHPRAHRGYVLEHVLIAERALGKLLPQKAEVHHVDEDRSNNQPENLVICPSRFYHKLLHRRMRALREFGDANARKCGVCNKWDLPKNLTIIPKSNRANGERAYHKSCNNKYHKERRQQLRV